MTRMKTGTNILSYIKLKRLQIVLVLIGLLLLSIAGVYKGGIWWLERSHQVDIQYQKFDMDLLPAPSFSFQQLKVVDKKREPGALPLLVADQLNIELTLGSLFGGRPELTLLQGNQLRLDLRAGDNTRFQSESTNSNWSFPKLGEVNFESIDISYRENPQTDATLVQIEHLLLSPKQKLQMNGSVSGLDFDFDAELAVEPKLLRMPQWALSAGEQNFQGTLEYDAKALIPLIGMNISSEEFRWGTADEVADPSASPLVLNDNLLPLSLLRDFNANINIEIKELASGVLVFENFRLPVRLENGVLTMGNASADFADGEILAAMEIDYKEGIRASWKAAIDMRKARLSELSGLAELGVRSAGRSSMLVEMRGYGRSSREFLATSDGKLQFKLGEFLMASKVLDAIGGDLLLTVFDQLEPESDDTEFTEIHCGAINLEVKDGKVSAKKKIIVQTGRADVLGDIDLDFHTERISLSFSPTARGGLGVNLNEYTSAIKIGGHISRPKLQMNALETAKIGLGIWASANTGGASKLAQSIYKKIINRDKSCHNLLPVVEESVFLAQE